MQRFQNQWEDKETGLYYNLNRYYDSDSGQYLSTDPIGLQGGLRTHGYVHDPMQWVDPLGLEGCGNTIRVGRWMHPDELAKMKATGRVQEGGGGLTRVAYPASPDTYRAAPKGNVYAEFDVPTNRALPHSKGTVKIPGPRSPDARVPGRNPEDFEMPDATNIKEF